MPIQRTTPQIAVDRVYGIRGDILNAPAPAGSGALPSARVDVLLKTHADRIRLEAIDAAAGRVNYTALKTSAAYQDYRQLTALLPAFDVESLRDRADKLAFWLNLYNALVIDGIIHYDVRSSVNEVRGFFRRAAYQVGAHRFSLDDIEHGILRANAGHPVIPGPQFGRGDPRRGLALDRIDPRIHFALVCGAVSCPPIRFYDPQHIDGQLDLAIRGFLEATTAVDPRSRIITVSKLLQWYAEDFGAGGWITLGLGERRRVLDALRSYLPQDAVRLMAESSAIQVRFAAYDWSLNAL